MLLSVHLAGPHAAGALLRHRGEPTGSTWCQRALTVPLAGGRRGPPRPTGAALLAAWEGDAALDDFVERHPLARALAGGWHVRLQPLRASGSWSDLPGLPAGEHPVADDEPVAVLTMGRLRLGRAVPFLRASAPAERRAVGDSAVLLGTALAAPPRFVSTFSVWSTAAAMRAYAYETTGHLGAMREHRTDAFHAESVFARFRPYRATGSWRGLAPDVAGAPVAV